MEERKFVGYEYQDVTVKKSMLSMYADGYENFGWSLESTSEPQGKIDSITLNFKRDRKNGRIGICFHCKYDSSLYRTRGSGFCRMDPAVFCLSQPGEEKGR